MKKLFLIFSLLFSLNIFATGNMTMMPVSTQKIANATLTCPTGKWCRVQWVISTYATNVGGTVTGGAGASSLSGEIILKSSESITGSYTPINSLACAGNSYVTVSVGGVVIARTDAWAAYTNFSGSCSASSVGNYNFYSMEYWN